MEKDFKKCKDCKYARYDKKNGYICNCDDSDNYSDYVDASYSCDQFEGKY